MLPPAQNLYFEMHAIALTLSRLASTSGVRANNEHRQRGGFLGYKYTVELPFPTAGSLTERGSLKKNNKKNPQNKGHVHVVIAEPSSFVEF